MDEADCGLSLAMRWRIKGRVGRTMLARPCEGAASLPGDASSQPAPSLTLDRLGESATFGVNPECACEHQSKA